MKNLIVITTTLILTNVIFWSCSDDDTVPTGCTKCITIQPGPNAEQEIQTAFIEVENDGWTIEFEPGIYDITGSLTMDGKSNVIIQSDGWGPVILSFTNQSDGGEGILISNSSNITFRDLEIRDTDGDALKVTDTDGILIEDVLVQWTGEPSSENGAYGFYPVLSTDVVIHNSTVRGASDAGIYVGQCENAMVYGNTASENVAGIEIENTIGADVYDNTVENNTGGILVFDLPGLSQSGANTRVFDNTIHDNNHDNFAAPGGIVAEVPPGTGILVLATKRVEIFSNTITDNQIVGVATFSYVSIAALLSQTIPPGFDPFFNEVHIHDNEISKTGSPNENQTLIGILLLLQSEFGGNPMPDLLTDGIFAPGGESNGGLCIQNNSSNYFVNLDLGSEQSVPSLDISVHDCSYGSLPEINIPG